MATATVNEIQQHLMKLFAFNKTKKSVEELKKVLFDYYNKQLVEYSKEFEEVTEEMWEAYNFENFDKHQAFQVDEDLMSKILEFYNSFNY